MRTLPIILALLCSVASGQTLELKPSTKTISYSVSVVEIAAPKTAQLSISVSDINRQPVPFEKLDATTYQINATGKVWFRAVAIDFDNKFFAEQTIEVDADTDGVSPPGPIDPPPGPVIEYDGPNEFGLGKLSFQTAPKYDAKVVAIYNAAGEYLYGRPSQKVIAVAGTDGRNGTDYELPLWLKNQMASQDDSWDAWYIAVMDRLYTLNASGKVRLTEDWYRSFREIAAGVEARK